MVSTAIGGLEPHQPHRWLRRWTVAMVLLAIGSGRRVVSIAIDEPYMARRKSESRGGPRDAHDWPFAKPYEAWHICQVYFLICQVAQNANSKYKTIGYHFL